MQMNPADGHFKQGMFPCKMDSRPFISIVMTYDSIPMILIKILMTVTLFPQTV